MSTRTVPHGERRHARNRERCRPILALVLLVALLACGGDDPNGPAPDELTGRVYDLVAADGREMPATWPNNRGGADQLTSATLSFARGGRYTLREAILWDPGCLICIEGASRAPSWSYGEEVGPYAVLERAPKRIVLGVPGNATFPGDTATISGDTLVLRRARLNIYWHKVDWIFVRRS